MDHISAFNMMAASFPLRSELSARSVAIRQPQDTNYVVANGYQGTQADRAIGIPMPIYMHNVLPTSEGFRSVGYTEQCVARSTSNDFDQAFVLQRGQEERIIFSPAGGTNYVFGSLGDFRSFPIPGPKRTGAVTTAYVSGKTYICYQRFGVFELTESGLEKIALQGLDVEQIDGICSGAGYLVAWTPTTVYWSSPMDATNFIPTLTTGAGGESIAEVRGAIVACFSITGGFVIYSTANAVFAGYTGNSAYPWRYKEIRGSAGIRRLEHVGSDTNYEFHFVWSTAGLLRVSGASEEAVNFAPEVTEFLASKAYETLSVAPATVGGSDSSWAFGGSPDGTAELHLGPGLLSLEDLSYDFAVKVTTLNGKYLAISYGKSEKSLEYVLVYDLALRRWGKLRVPHVDCFRYVQPPGTLGDNVMNMVGFLRADGSIVTVDFSRNAIAQDAVMIFGKVQSNRGLMTEFMKAEIENMNSRFGSLYLLSSYDGKTWLPAEKGYCLNSVGQSSGWLFRRTALNHCLLIVGTFELNTIIVHFNNAGMP